MLAIGKSSETVYSEVNTHSFTSFGQDVHFFVETECYEIATNTVLDYRNCTGIAFELSRPVNIQAANLGKAQVPIQRFIFERTACEFCGLFSTFRFETWIPVSFFKEITKCGLQMTECLLKWNTRDLVKEVQTALFFPPSQSSRSLFVIDGSLGFPITVSTEPQCLVVNEANASKDLNQFSLLT